MFVRPLAVNLKPPRASSASFVVVLVWMQSSTKQEQLIKIVTIKLSVDEKKNDECE